MINKNYQQTLVVSISTFFFALYAQIAFCAEKKTNDLNNDIKLVVDNTIQNGSTKQINNNTWIYCAQCLLPTEKNLIDRKTPDAVSAKSKSGEFDDGSVVIDGDGISSNTMAKSGKLINSQSLLVYFGFGRTELSGVEVEKLTDALRAVPKNMHVKIVGYTDEIGGDKFNKSLSARRALAVARSIDVLRPDINVVTKDGMGKARPGIDCFSIHSKKLRIDCLAPDRRAEIEPVPNHSPSHED